MSDYRTNLRTASGHPDIVVSVDPELDVGTEWLLGFFENEIGRVRAIMVRGDVVRGTTARQS